MSSDPRRLAVSLVSRLREGVARALLRAFVRGREEEARRLLAREVHDPERWLADPVFREWLLEALDLRISPPDPHEVDALDTEPFDLDTSESRFV